MKTCLSYSILLLTICVLGYSNGSRHYKLGKRHNSFQDLSLESIGSDEINTKAESSPHAQPDLPILLTISQYDKIAKHLKFVMTNVPAEAKRVHYININAGSNDPAIDTSISENGIIDLTGFAKYSTNFYLTTKKEYGVVCSSKEIFRVETERSLKNLPIAYRLRHESASYWIKWCSKQDCTLKIDWKHECTFKNRTYVPPTGTEHITTLTPLEENGSFGQRESTGVNVQIMTTQPPFTKGHIPQNPIGGNTQQTNKPTDKADGNPNITSEKRRRRLRRSCPWYYFGTNFCYGPAPTISFDQPFILGKQVTLTCSTSETDATIQWYSYINGTKILSLLPVNAERNKLVLTIKEFDYGTNWKCIVRANYQGKSVASQIIPANSSIPEKVLDHLPKMYYEINKTIDFQCDKTMTKDYMATIWGHGIRIFESFQTLSEKDNGSIISCLYFINDISKSAITRVVSNETVLIYKEKNEDTLSYEEASKGKASNMINYYYIGAVVLGMLIVLSITILLIVKRIDKKKATVIPETKSSENAQKFADTASETKGYESNLYANQLLYAELDMAPSAQSDRRPIIDDTQYAQITSPCTVLYAQIDPRRRNENPQTEESTYAQIDHTKT